MPGIRWLLRAKRWAQNPPSGKTVMLVLALVGTCLLVVAVERFIGWPAWMTLDPGAGRAAVPRL